MVKNQSQFYLGSVAPDAVNVYSFAPKEQRTKAHLRSPDLEQWTQNAIDFYTNNKDIIDNDLLLGYVLHAFCDMAWDKKYDRFLISEIAKLDLSDEQKNNARWDEFYYFDKTQFTADWWLNEVKPLLEKSIPSAINGIDEKQIADFKQFLLTEYENTINPVTPKIITGELVNEFIYYAVATFKNQL